LTRLSWLRRFFRDSKGISTAIGTILLVLAMFVISSNVFLFTISQNTLYSQAVRESHETDADRFNEKIVALNGNYTVDGNEVTVEADLTNAGGVAAQIINLWVFDTTIQEYNYTVMSLNLGAGESRMVSVVVTIVGAHQDHTFSSWFVTARGNTVAIEEARIEGVIVAEVAQGIGLMALDFMTFRYFLYNGSNKLANYPAGVHSYNVPRTPEIAFGITLTNYDPLKRTIQLNQYAQVWLYFPKAPGQSLVWHIVNVDSNGTITTPYSPISLAYRQTRLNVFASANPRSFSKVSIPAAVKDLPCALNLLLLGTVGSDDYGQNIPFVSLFVYEP